MGHMKGGLNTNESIKPGETITSPNNQTALTLTPGGNLILTNIATGTVLWQTNTEGQDVPLNLFMDADGDLHLNDRHGGQIWRSNSGGGGKKNCQLHVQDDGNMVIYKNGKATSSTAVWASGTYQNAIGSQTGEMGPVYHPKGPAEFISGLVKTAGQVIPGPVLAAAANAMPPGMQSGIQAASDALSSPIGAAALSATRAALPPDAQQAFDVGASIINGVNNGPQPPAGMTDPTQLAGWYAAHGMADNSMANKQAMVGTMLAHPGLAAGINAAVAYKQYSWWQQLLHWLGLYNAPPPPPPPMIAPPGIMPPPPMPPAA